MLLDAKGEEKKEQKFHKINTEEIVEMIETKIEKDKAVQIT
jgi:hypothetical protein